MTTKQRTTAPRPTEHDDDCSRPPMLWQQPWKPWAQRLGHCPECGACAVDREPPMTPARRTRLAEQLDQTEGASS